MKILMISRATLYSSPGGDTIQIDNTAKYLRKLGIEVDVKLTNETIDYTQYDLMHFFNIIRPNDFLHHIKACKLPFVISTIFVDYSEFERKARTGPIGFLGKIFSSDQMEYIKVIARWLKNNESLGSLSYLWRGQKRSIQMLLKNAAMLLPNSQNEYKRLEDHFGVSNAYKVIPNAIDLTIFDISSQIINDKFKDSVICVGRIEGRKNQLNVIRAINQTEYKLFIIGKKSPNQEDYYQACLKEASQNPNIEFIDHLGQHDLATVMHTAKVHVLASWFETTGLVTLEAAYLGCNVVVTDKGDQKEYFEDMATYCNPEKIDSIVHAIDTAMRKPHDDRLRKKIVDEYTWEKTAYKTLQAYKKVLGES